MNHFAEFVFLLIWTFGLLFGVGLILLAIIPRQTINAIQQFFFSAGEESRPEQRGDPDSRGGPR